jgi:hypothetical protein
MEYDLEAYHLDQAELEDLADLVVGGPLYIRHADRKVVASVKSVIIKSHSLVLSIRFSDSFLEKNIANDRALFRLYTMVDPVEFLIGDRS